MKATQKLAVTIESFAVVVKFADMSKQFMPAVAKLERDGDEFGPVVMVIDQLCVTVGYADKKRGPTKPTIFGYDADEFMVRQQK